MKVLIIGANGQLGTDLQTELTGCQIIPLLHKDVEITDMDMVKQVVTTYKPEVIVNTAVCHTDDAERNPDKAYRVNTLGAGNVAVAAQAVGAVVVQVSSDYVFGGDEKRSKPYTEFDVPYPVNTCGVTKLLGERAVQQFCHRYFIIRTSGLFGVAGSSGKGGNFVETMVRLSRERNELRVVDDQFFSPTFSQDLARKLGELLETECYGVYHVTNSDICSWYQFTVEIMRQMQIVTTVRPISSNEFPTPARRPKYSVLDNYHLRLLGMDDMRLWQQALCQYLKAKGYIK